MLAKPMASEPPASSTLPCRPKKSIDMTEREYMRVLVAIIGNATLANDCDSSLTCLHPCMQINVSKLNYHVSTRFLY